MLEPSPRIRDLITRVAWPLNRPPIPLTYVAPAPHLSKGWGAITPPCHQGAWELSTIGPLETLSGPEAQCRWYESGKYIRHPMLATCHPLGGNIS